MSTNLYYPPTQNAVQKTLGAQLDQGTTASATLNNITSIPNKPGVMVINRIDSDGTELSSSVREWVSYTGTSGSTVTSLTRGLGGSTDQDHAVGSVVEFIWDITSLQAILDKLDGTDTVALEDTNGNEMLVTSTTTSAVNHVGIKNAAAGAGPQVQALGDDTNIDLVALPKGTGVLSVTGTTDYESNVSADDDVPNKKYVLDGTYTMTNKRITSREGTVTSNATPTINTDNVDIFTITALATDITSMTTNLSGTPTDGQKLIIRIQDSGSGQTITWGASYESAGGTLPTSITAGKKAYVGLIYNADDSKWDCVAAVEEA